MDTAVNDPCPRGCPWPARECDHPRQVGPEVTVVLLVGGIAASGYVVVGVLLARLALRAAQAVIGRGA